MWALKYEVQKILTHGVLVLLLTCIRYWSTKLILAKTSLLPKVLVSGHNLRVLNVAICRRSPLLLRIEMVVSAAKLRREVALNLLHRLEGGSRCAGLNIADFDANHVLGQMNLVRSAFDDKDFFSGIGRRITGKLDMRTGLVTN